MRKVKMIFIKVITWMSISFFTITKRCKFEKNVRISLRTDLKNSYFGEYSNIVKNVQVANSKIGKRTSIGRFTKVRDSDIGEYCSISWDTTIGAVAHPFDRLTSHAFTYRRQFGVVKDDSNLKSKRTTIGNDVWIGCNCVIISGVSIGNGAIVGAGAVVTSDVPPFAIVGGVPAKVIRYRFDKETVSMIEKIKWWDWSDSQIKDNIELFSKPINIDILKKMEMYL